VLFDSEFEFISVVLMSLSCIYIIAWEQNWVNVHIKSFFTASELSIMINLNTVVTICYAFGTGEEEEEERSC
jgi:hypothetical protein